MKEPTIETDEGVDLPLSLAPSILLREALMGIRYNWVASDDNDCVDPDVALRYAAILLRERGL